MKQFVWDAQKVSRFDRECFTQVFTDTGGEGSLTQGVLFERTLRALSKSYLACKVSLTPLNYKRALSDYMNIWTVQMSPKYRRGHQHRQAWPPSSSVTVSTRPWCHTCHFPRHYYTNYDVISAHHFLVRVSNSPSCSSSSSSSGT